MVEEFLCLWMGVLLWLVERVDEIGGKEEGDGGVNGRRGRGEVGDEMGGILGLFDDR